MNYLVNTKIQEHRGFNMRKWNDKGPQEMQEITKATIIFFAVINSFTVMDILFTKFITYAQIFGLVSSCIVIYLMYSGNFYKILKYYAEWRLKRRDNKWR